MEVVVCMLYGGTSFPRNEMKIGKGGEGYSLSE